MPIYMIDDKILFSEDNKIATGEDCCCGVQPSSCFNGYPEITVTITAEDVDLPAPTWCGYTWIKSTTTKTLGTQRYSGETAIACPTQYIYNNGTNTTGALVYQERWRYASTGGDEHLRLNRFYITTIPPIFGSTYQTIRLDLGVQGYTSAWSQVVEGYKDAEFNTPPSLATNGVTASPSDFTLKDYMFGSLTVNNRTYSWEKGNGWTA